MCYSEDRITEIMYQAYSLGIHVEVFNKISELSQFIKVYDTHSRAQVYEQAFNLVTNGSTEQSGDNTPIQST